MRDDEPLPMWAVEPRESSYSKGKTTSTFVPPAKRVTVPTPVIDGEVVDVGGVWGGTAHVSETGKPQDRAWATLIRALPITVLLGVLGVPATWLALGDWDWLIGILAIGLLMLAGILGVTIMDLQWNSPGSTEVRRIGAAFRLKKLEVQQRHELRRRIVDAYLKNLEDDE